MTWPCYLFDSAQVKRLGSLITALMLLTELLCKELICRTQVFSDDLFSNVTTDVLPIIALFLLLWFFYFGFEYFNFLTLLVLGKSRCEIKHEASFLVDRAIDELTKEGAIGSGPFDG